MKPLFRLHLASAPALVAAASLSLSGCSGNRAAVRPDDSEVGRSGSSTGPRGKTGPEEVRISSRAMIMFEEANHAWDVQRRSRTPDYEAVQRKYEAALSADPRLAEADYDLGVIAERQGNYDAAAAHYKSALRKKPSLKQAAVNLAVLEQNRGDTQSALGGYSEVARQLNDDAQSRAHMAELYRQSGDSEKAVDLSRQALTRDPKSFAALKTMMGAYYDKKEYSLARLVAIRALKLDEGDPDVYHTLGLISLAEHQDEKAMIQFNKALGAQPSYRPSQLMLAKLAFKNNDYPGAAAQMQKLVQEEPKNAQYHLNLGVALRNTGNLDRALQEYDLAERLDPRLPGIYLNRGIILHKYKDAPERGLELYKKYIELKGGDVAVGQDSPVFALMKEAEQVVQAKADAARMEAEQKKANEAAKRSGGKQPEGKSAPASKPLAREGAEGGREPGAGMEGKGRPSVESAKGQGGRLPAAVPVKEKAPVPNSPPDDAEKGEPGDGL